jgi:bifunctional pyridoxal-dependent enzyme with beta-cystathionase and maltose regulon repressor activities
MRWAEQPEGVIPLTAADPDFRAAPAIRAALAAEAARGVYCFTRVELESIVTLALQRGVPMLSDEIWSEIIYRPAVFTSALALAPELAANVVVAHGFSKSFGLAGCRIGYVAPLDGAATLSQIAAAYDHTLPWLDAFLEHLCARRDQCVAALQDIGALYDMLALNSLLVSKLLPADNAIHSLLYGFFAVGLLPIALIYGIDPNQILPKLLQIQSVGPGVIHIFRAIMGL